jgi:penicillin-binding protein 1A
MRLSKNDILELSLNQVYFGGGAYGVEAASRRYFDKPARELTLVEAALIAGLLKAPSKYSPANNPGAARARGRVVLDKMLEAGFITQEDENRALAQNIVFADAKMPKAAADSGYVVDYVLEQLPPIIGTDHAELIVETTLDKDLQHRAQEIVTDNLTKKGPALGATQAALVVLDGDGGIRALVGGRDYAESQFNRAVKAKRQPGSAFKPFVYLAALEHGMSPDSVTADQPITIGGWSPKNDNGQYLGNITLRQALAQSVNTVAARLNQDVGRGRTIEVAQRLGIKSDLREGPSLALGTSEVTLLEMAGAYTAFSNGGEVVDPHVITRVRTGSGRVLFESQPTSTDKVADPGRIGALNDMMNAAVVYGTGRRAGIPDQPAGGKTGTTQDFRDAWFIGYTSRLTAGVWIGNDSGKPMNRATGGGLPAEIWNQVMRVAHVGKAPLALPGTVLGLPGNETAAWAGAPPLVLTSTTPRVPRVVEAHETLPWQTPPRDAQPLAPVVREPVIRDAVVQRTMAADASAGAEPRRAAHPSDSIAEDFISQALADTPGGNAPTTGVATPEAVDKPHGLMPFGNWW